MFMSQVQKTKPHTLSSAPSSSSAAWGCGHQGSHEQIQD